MGSDDIFGTVFFLAFGAIGFYLISRVFRFGGVKAALFGARIGHTLGEVEGAGGKWITATIRVHTLEGKDDRSIGLEFVQKGPGAFSMQPFPMTAAEARKLTQLIEAALHHPRA